MSKIHAISDVHGYAHLLRRGIDALDLGRHTNDALVLCGDYINRGPDSAGTLYCAKETQETYGDRVVVLLGNHERDFLGWLDDDSQISWLTTHSDRCYVTIASFLDEADLPDLFAILRDGFDSESIHTVSRELRQRVLAKHAELIDWIRALPMFHETENQVFVHAGINEESGENWLDTTDESIFLTKDPAQTGFFYKTIIAGHLGAFAVGGVSYDPYFDGASHWFIDPTIHKSEQLNILTYDIESDEYSTRIIR